MERCLCSGRAVLHEGELKITKIKQKIFSIFNGYIIYLLIFTDGEDKQDP